MTGLVAPFRGWRYAAAGGLGRLLCPPYDVISPGFQKVLARRSRWNAVHLELPRDGSYRAAARRVRGWRSAGILVRESEPSLYVHEHEFREGGPGRRCGGRVRRRCHVLGAVRLLPWGRAVTPHEATLPTPRRDRARHLAILRANTSPVLGLFRDPGGTVRRALRAVRAGAPLAAGRTPEGERHMLWRVTGREARRLAAVIGRRGILIADGHHRYAAARAFARTSRGRRVPGADRILMALIASGDRGLVMRPTHRVLARGILPGPAVRRLPRRAGRFPTQVLWDEVYRPRGLDEVRLKERGRVAFTPDSIEAVRRAKATGGVAILLPASPVASLFAAVRRGPLPPKSTYFFPKAPAGLVFRMLDVA